MRSSRMQERLAKTQGTPAATRQARLNWAKQAAVGVQASPGVPVREAAEACVRRAPAPGFDSNVSGWNVAGNGTFHWVSVRGNDQDATSCPYSGFGRFYSTGTLTVPQCVAVSTAKSYNISSALSNSSLGDFTNYSFGEMQCNLDWFSSSDCSAASLSDGALSRQWLHVDWSSALWDGSPWYPPTGASSARLSCSDACDGTDIIDHCYANLDEMGITEAPAVD